MTCTRKERPVLPPIPAYSVPGNAYICPKSEMTQQSCCNNKDIITFHASIVCSGESSDCSYALYGCTNLKTVYVPSTINYISYGMFQAATSIQAIYIQDGVVGIGGKVSVTSLLLLSSLPSSCLGNGLLY